MNKEWLIKYCITNFVIKDQQKSLFNVIPAAILWGLFFIHLNMDCSFLLYMIVYKLFILVEN